MSYATEQASIIERSKQMTTELEQKILDAAREWALDRAPRDSGEKALFIAVCRAYPNELVYKENCTCGEQDDCDECPTKAAMEAALNNLEGEVALPAMGLLSS